MFPLTPRKLQSRGFAKPPERIRLRDTDREPQRVSRKASFSGGTTGPAPKEPEPIRDEAYRRWVASLPCYACRIEGYSNAAHPNSGKTKGVKRDDDECFPLCCDRPGVMGCHSKFDQYLIVGGRQMAAYERKALEWTKQQGAKA